MKPVALILSGSGRADGSEIHESVAALLALSQENLPVKIYAPDIEQFKVVDHLTGRPSEESRNVLVEAARIARGKINPLSELSIDDVSAIILPGGLGAASNLWTYAQDGIEGEIEKETYRVLTTAMNQKLPLGFICIAPVLGARIAKECGKSITLTIGNDASTAEDIETLGCKHLISDPNHCVVDKENRVVSAPAYMSAKTVAECYNGIRDLVKEISNMIAS
jgi:enhancing lycopene biosynthesis protein 2